MGKKIEYVDKKIVLPPHKYVIPSKVVESPGKSFGIKLKTMKTTD